MIIMIGLHEGEDIPGLHFHLLISWAPALSKSIKVTWNLFAKNTWMDGWLHAPLIFMPRDKKRACIHNSKKASVSLSAISPSI